eukprot:TRINITY_DN16000_c0_g1_i2.p1 TRINITY_DN16000_c0_g1~~TRINITY_DN16000_c0_g1_i2.p1  ORF type:complete len:233 (+),score=49.67 TRINITY_DN16000_c0_g1_i2:134-832(+)
MKAQKYMVDTEHMNDGDLERKRVRRQDSEENLSSFSNAHDSIVSDRSIDSAKNESGVQLISQLSTRRAMYERRVKDSYKKGIKAMPSFKVGNKPIKRKPSNRIYVPSKPAISRLGRKNSGSVERLASSDSSRESFTVPSEDPVASQQESDLAGKPAKKLAQEASPKELNDSGEEVETSIAEESKEFEGKEREVAETALDVAEIPIEIVDSNYAQVLLNPSASLDELRAVVMR